MTWPPQNQLCTIAAVITGTLSLTLLFILGLVFWLFSMAHELGRAIMLRRAAMLFAGLCVLAWRVRDVPRSPTLKAAFQAFSVAMAGLAVIGAVEFLRGGVGVGIALAIIVEVFFVLAFLHLATAES